MPVSRESLRVTTLRFVRGGKSSAQISQMTCRRENVACNFGYICHHCTSEAKERKGDFHGLSSHGPISLSLPIISSSGLRQVGIA